MKSFIVLLLVIQAHVLWAFNSSEQVCTGSVATMDPNRTYGGSVPWPWGREIDFPLPNMEGVWQISENGCARLFIFKLQKQTKNKAEHLSISEYDPSQCRVISTGQGYKKNRVVWAVMKGASGDFGLTVHAFRDAKTKDVHIVTKVIALTKSQQSATFEINRLTKDMSVVCKPKWQR